MYNTFADLSHLHWCLSNLRGLMAIITFHSLEDDLVRRKVPPRHQAFFWTETRLKMCFVSLCNSSICFSFKRKYFNLFHVAEADRLSGKKEGVMWESLAQWQVGLDVCWRDFTRFAAKAWQEALRKWTEAGDQQLLATCWIKRGLDARFAAHQDAKMHHGFTAVYCNSIVFESSLVDLDGFLALQFAVCVAFNLFLSGFAAQRRRSC